MTDPGPVSALAAAIAEIPGVMLVDTNDTGSLSVRVLDDDPLAGQDDHGRRTAEVFRFLRSTAFFEGRLAGVSADATIRLNLSEFGNDVDGIVYMIRTAVERARGEAIFGPDIELGDDPEEGMFWEKPWHEP